MRNKEAENIKYYKAWSDDYLKVICAFANAKGGTIYIGKNDNGTVTGISHGKELVDAITHKIRAMLGIVVDINLHKLGAKHYLEIITSKSSCPISYKGEYHYRSGSITKVLKGVALTQFLFEKTGMTWDSMPLDNLCVSDFWQESFDIFKKQAYLSNRLDKKDLDMSNEQLLESLGLIRDGKILRAGMMLFFQNPEKWVNGSYIKIGYFTSHSEISYMDEIHGSLISQAEKAIDLIFTKYLKAYISYDGVTRVETYPFAKAAIREAVYNAIVHKNYASQIPIQISIYKDKLYIANDCILPSTWTADTLMSQHRSKPFNPNIANGFFRAGFIETWGRGIEKIYESCKSYGSTLPEYTLYPEEIMIKFEAINTDADITIQNNGDMNTDTNTDTNTDMNTDTNTDTDFKVDLLLESLKENPEVTQNKLAEHFGVTKRTIERNMNILKKDKIIRRVGNNRTGYWQVLKKP